MYKMLLYTLLHAKILPGRSPGIESYPHVVDILFDMYIHDIYMKNVTIYIVT